MAPPDGLDKAAFNFGNLTLAVWASGTLLFAISGAKPLLHGGQAATLILPLALLALTYFVINTGLIAAAIGLENGNQSRRCLLHPAGTRLRRERVARTAPRRGAAAGPFCRHLAAAASTPGSL